MKWHVFILVEILNPMLSHGKHIFNKSIIFKVKSVTYATLLKIVLAFVGGGILEVSLIAVHYYLLVFSWIQFENNINILIWVTGIPSPFNLLKLTTCKTNYWIKSFYNRHFFVWNCCSKKATTHMVIFFLSLSLKYTLKGSLVISRA